MATRNQHSVEFEKDVGEIVHTADESEVEELIESELESGITIVECYSEYPEPYGHNPYFSITVEYEQVFVDQKEKQQETTEVIKTVLEDYIGADIHHHIAEAVA